ncbi:amino acid adenylation, partial [Pseudomonas syringae pv. pisi str. 1704B]
FASGEGEPRQLVHPAMPLVMPSVDLRDLSPTARDAHVSMAVEQEAKAPFDLASGPLLRA